MHAVEGNTAIEVSAGAKYVVKHSQETFRFDNLMESLSVKARRGLRILYGQLGKRAMLTGLHQTCSVQALKRLDAHSALQI